MNLYDISREIKSVLKEDKKDLDSLGIKNDKLAFVLVDGLGWNLAKDIRTSVNPIQVNSIFPSITVTVFATLLTAKKPGEHGILGWRIINKENGSIENLMQKLKNESIELDTYFQNTSSLFIMPDVATKSMMSRLKVIPYFTFWDGLYKFKTALEMQSNDFIFFYIPYVDAASHLYGPYHEVTLSTARDVVQKIDCISTYFKEKYSILVTADHGHTQISNIVDLKKDKDFMEEMDFPPYGDHRSLMFKGRFPKSLLKYGANVIEGGKVEEMIGGSKNKPDYLVIPKDDSIIIYWDDDRKHEFRGSHGGLTQDEMKIPLYLYQ
ncbi:alkaline phosphatase family protein [Acidianus sp. HS-5]|uniref:alkaline phosphatase family protein n=1 Tax=Acidianus sp. HS-5 TaxID=2886040 RepID=UPI001F211F21|nr:alkaline phosphatase family protein [Acidianus sp. HS-5]BDC18918.1 nucleotide pyrophosphatase [Acidianus sp. HS-5]